MSIVRVRSSAVEACCESLGSRVYQGVQVSEVLFDDKSYARGIRLRIAEQES